MRKTTVVRKITTGPAKDLSELGKLLTVPDKRDRLLMACSMYMGLRGTSELTKLKWSDLLEDRVQIFSPKTGKTRFFIIPDDLKAIIADCYEGQPVDSFAFTGRRGQKGDKNLSNRGLNLILRKYFTEFGIEFYGNNSSHCMRKSFSKNFILSNGNTLEAAELLRRELNHSSLQTTMVYAGITEANHAKMVNNIKYG